MTKKYNSFGKVISKSICLMTCGEENPSQKGGNHLLKDIFTKKKKYASVPSDQAKHDVPEGIMTKCPKCKKIMLTKELDKNMRVCMNCDYHFPMNAKQRIESLMDEQSFENLIRECSRKIRLVSRDIWKSLKRSRENILKRGCCDRQGHHRRTPGCCRRHGLFIQNGQHGFSRR